VSHNPNVKVRIAPFRTFFSNLNSEFELFYRTNNIIYDAKIKKYILENLTDSKDSVGLIPIPEASKAYHDSVYWGKVHSQLELEERNFRIIANEPMIYQNKLRKVQYIDYGAFSHILAQNFLYNSAFENNLSDLVLK
jgi:hypothetical protein